MFAEKRLAPRKYKNTATVAAVFIPNRSVTHHEKFRNGHVKDFGGSSKARANDTY